MVSTTLDLENTHHARQLLGERGRNIKLVEKRTGARVTARGNRLTITGEESCVATAARALTEIYDLLEKGYPVMGEDVQKTLDMVAADSTQDVKSVFLDTISIPSASKHISPKSPRQKAYVDAIRKETLVFSVGPAGTGKTYLAVAMAVSALFEKQFKRIVLARPAVEAGEKLGFLPGDIAEKVNPYLRPLYDALEDMMDLERVRRFIEKGVIEIAPLAFMRGRTLNDSFVILDEAQNTTINQMKMFLTRLGTGSRAVVTGDITQIDLARADLSGLIHVQHILSHIEAISFVYFTERDVVRHSVVQKNITAYERHERRPPNDGGGGTPENPGGCE